MSVKATTKKRPVAPEKPRYPRLLVDGVGLVVLAQNPREGVVVVPSSVGQLQIGSHAVVSPAMNDYHGTVTLENE